MPGYPDFRRQQDYDSLPAFVDDDGITRNGAFTVGPFYVGLWHAIAGFVATGTLPALVTLLWTTDSAGLVQAGRRAFVVDPAIVNGDCQMRFVNLGPYLTLTMAPFVGGNWVEFLRLFPTNRVFPTEMPGQDPLLTQHGVVALGAGLSNTRVFDGYYAGPALWWLNAGTQTGQVRLEARTAAGTWDTFVNLVLAAQQNLAPTIVIPPGACRSVITNTGAAAGDFNSRVTPSLPGG